MKIRAFVVALAMTALGMAAATPAQAANKAYTITVDVNGASGKTLVLLAKSGRVLATRAVPSNAAANLTLTTPSIASTVINGASIQVLNDGGEYYGPVVVGWKTTKKVTAAYKYVTKKVKGKKKKVKVKYYKTSYVADPTQVRTALTVTGTTDAAIDLGALTVSNGFGKLSAVHALASTGTLLAATAYKPVGAGNAGKVNQNLNLTFTGMRGLRTVDAVDVPVTELTDGADPDKDGIPTAFDVNDDGDAKTDEADTQTPSVDVIPQNEQASVPCESLADFSMFSNFKSTNTAFEGNINFFGTGSFQATNERIATALSTTLTVVLSAPPTQVCGSNVDAVAFKGVDVAYAPTDWVTLPTLGQGQDYQWQVGSGQINGQAVNGLSGHQFASPNEISGQDAFVMRVHTVDDRTFDLVASPGFIFVTHPLPYSYQLDNGEVNTFTYGASRAAYGSTVDNNPVLDISSSTVMHIQIAAPQRLAFDGEAGSFWNLGGMSYMPDIPNKFGGGSGPGRCDSQTTTDNDPDTQVVENEPRRVTLNITLGACFSSRNPPVPWGSGQQVLQGGFDLQVVPVGGGGNSAQKFGVRTIE